MSREHNLLLIIVFVLSFSYRFHFAFSFPYLFLDDAHFHYRVANSIRQDGDVLLIDKLVSSRVNSYPPASHISIGILALTLDSDVIAALKLFSILFSSLTIFSLFLYARTLVGDGLAVLCTLPFQVHATSLSRSLFCVPEALALFLMPLFFLYLRRERTYLASMLGGLIALTHGVCFIVVVLAGILYLMLRSNERGKFLALLVMILLSINILAPNHVSYILIEFQRQEAVPAIPVHDLVFLLTLPFSVNRIHFLWQLLPTIFYLVEGGSWRYVYYLLLPASVAMVSGLSRYLNQALTCILVLVLSAYLFNSVQVPDMSYFDDIYRMMFWMKENTAHDGIVYMYGRHYVSALAERPVVFDPYGPGIENIGEKWVENHRLFSEGYLLSCPHA